MNSEILRAHAEEAYAEELYELEQADSRPRPANWRLSPWAVATYILGGTLDNGFEVNPKYIGNGRLIEIAIATLTTDRALLLMGIPGTGKTWVAEHLAAAISGDSTLLVQGTAGTSEEAIRYGWNYASLIAHGPTAEALVPSPIMIAMRDGKQARVEEMTRIPADVQDALITILSEKVLPIPELNHRDKGVNDLSSALRRRFNTVVLPLPATAEEEVTIVQKRVSELGQTLQLPAEPPALEEIRRVVTIFRELRGGVTADGKAKLKSPSSTLSTAEAISVMNSGLALAAHFGDGTVRAHDLAAGLVGAVVKDPLHDAVIWREYLDTVVQEREAWEDLYRACRELV
jgi:MoxR-like ATPase